MKKLSFKDKVTAKCHPADKSFARNEPTNLSQEPCPLYYLPLLESHMSAFQVLDEFFF